jgi:hypothetical protein
VEALDDEAEFGGPGGDQPSLPVPDDRLDLAVVVGFRDRDAAGSERRVERVGGEGGRR